MAPNGVTGHSYPFFNLPRELRDNICEEAIRSGHVNLLRTCKQADSEAKGYLPTHGLCRINIDASKDASEVDLKFYLDEDAVKAIRNVRITVALVGSMSIRSLYKLIQPIRRLAFADIVHNCCHIILEDHLDGAPFCC